MEGRLVSYKKVTSQTHILRTRTWCIEHGGKKYHVRHSHDSHRGREIIDTVGVEICDGSCERHQTLPDKIVLEVEASIKQLSGLQEKD